MVDITLLTDDRFVNPTEKNWYIQNVLDEDRLVLESLEKKGLECNRKSWSDPNYNWSDSRYLLFRTTWDYFERLDEFMTWMESVSARTKLINPAELIFWNLNKNYLSDLKVRGVNVVASVFVEKNKSFSLSEIANQQNWKDLVIKPVVSGAAMDTHFITNGRIAESQTLFEDLVSKQAMIIQEAQSFITNEGEYSLVVIGGKYSHAVKKIAKAGDFRVQDDFGGTVHDYDPTYSEIEFAEKAVAACDIPPAYARVDMIYDNQGQPAIMELELIEPELWFRKVPQAAEALAEEISRMIK